MRKLLLGLIVVAVAASGWIVFAVSRNEDTSLLPTPVSSDEYALLSTEASEGRVVILDVRTKADFDEMHAVAARHYDLEWLKIGVMPDIDTSQEIYVYCRSGDHSAQAVSILQANGYTRLNDLGGLDDWLDGSGLLQRSPYLDSEILEQSGISTSPPVLGKSDAPVTVVQYIDFGCPYCLHYISEIEPSLISEYVDQGLVKLEFHNAALQGSSSVTIAAAAYCANDQDAFWPYHDQIAQIRLAGSADLGKPSELVSLAERLDLNKTTFQQCLFNGDYVDLVRAETYAARQNGILGVPAFRINDAAIEGLRPIEEFRALIDNQVSS